MPSKFCANVAVQLKLPNKIKGKLVTGGLVSQLPVSRLTVSRYENGQKESCKYLKLCFRLNLCLIILMMINK